MDWLNYHHLKYFWTIAREGSIKRACEVLNLSQPALSAQLRSLEDSLGEKLFSRVGRSLILTEMGKVVFRYAEEIFNLGQELTNTVKGRGTSRQIRLVVGIAEVVPKVVVYKLLQAAYKGSKDLQLLCWEGRFDRLLSELALHSLDIIVTDSPLPPNVSVQGYTHLLGESGVSLFGKEKLLKPYRRGFPQSLNEAPFLLPTKNSVLRRLMDDWFRRNSVHPHIIGEFEDGATMKAFGQAGEGLFPGSTIVAPEIAKQYEVKKLKDLEGLQERFYGITVERRMIHPGVLAIVNAARTRIFGQNH